MKKIIFVFTFILFTVASFAGNISVSGAVQSPAPAKKNQTISLSYRFLNSAEAIPQSAGVPTLITISLRKLDAVIDPGTGLPIVTFSVPNQFFVASYDAATKVITLEQAGPILEDSYVDISFQAVVNAETAQADMAAGGQGMLINIVPGSTVTGNLSVDDDTRSYSYTNGVLPVAFGPIGASFSGEKLLISWETLSEKNNKEFIVEASLDGKEFHSLGTVTSAATDGNSDVTLKYSFSKAWEDASSLLGFPVISVVLVMLFLLAFFMKRKNAAILLPIILLTITVAGFSCKKDKNAVSYADRPDVFVRIAQVDKDGTIAHSRVVKILADN